MTTDHELHDLLASEADVPVRQSAGWDDIVRRGRHHRRVARARTGLAAGGLAALTVIGVVAVSDLGDDDTSGVVANDPDPTTTTIAPAIDRGLPDLQVARVSGVFVTLSINAADPATGFDPCTEESASVIETPTQVTVQMQRHYDLEEHQIWWAACQASAVSGWATIELTEPLGDRQLVDASDGERLHVVDNAELRFPSQLPEPFEIERWDEFAQGTYEGVPLDAWTFSWTSQDLVLNVGRWPVDGERPEGCGGGEPIEGPGVTGQLCIAESSAILNWIDGSSFRIVELVDVSGGPLPGDIDLVAIANGLRPLG
jgi:hypothetical protein